LLAFAMGFHERLGAHSRARQSLDKELVEMILNNTTSEPILLQLRELRITSGPWPRRLSNNAARSLLGFG
jgi:hypothetical protein